jgi:hypothetical protein
LVARRALWAIPIRPSLQAVQAHGSMGKSVQVLGHGFAAQTGVCEGVVLVYGCHGVWGG